MLQIDHVEIRGTNDLRNVRYYGMLKIRVRQYLELLNKTAFVQFITCEFVNETIWYGRFTDK